MDIQTAIKHYCNYQDRSHKEVRNKLYELGCRTAEVEELIAELIQTGLLSEERYARSIARGKFRLKHWGRKKIVRQLQFQQVSSYCISKALSEIDPQEYRDTLKKLAQKKWEELKMEKDPFSRKMRVLRYLHQKGYESDLSKDVLQEISGE